MADALDPDRWRSAIVDSAHDAIIGETLDGTIVSWNAGAERLYGYVAAEVIGKPITLLVPAGRLDEVSAILGRIRVGDRVDHFRTTRQAKGGRLVDVSVSVSPVRDESGAMVGASVVARDVSAEEEALRALSRRARVAQLAAQVGRAFAEGRDLEGTLQRCADAVARQEGIAYAAIWTTETSVCAPAPLDPVTTRLGSTGVSVPHAAGLVDDDTVVCFPLVSGDRPVGVLATRPSDGRAADDVVAAVVPDIAAGIEHKRREDVLSHRALHDALTGLPNRLLLTDRIELAFATAGRRSAAVALLFVDLDDFKLVNDRFGHSLGDAMLVEMAERFRSAVRSGDTVARFGGDEFVVVTEDGADGVVALSIARRILGVLARPAVVGGRSHTMRASIGIALSRRAGEVDELLARADAAMYRAKELGGGRVELDSSG